MVKASVKETPAQGAVIQVPLDRLLPNPWDPRRERTPEAVRDMAESIRQVGLLQPLTARLAKADGCYELAYGMTRLLALKQMAAAGEAEETIGVVFRALTDAEMAVVALTENSQRTDLTPLEKYWAYRKALDTIPELTVGTLAQSLGIDHSTLSNALRLLQLPPVVLDRVDSGEMSARAAREFLCLMAEDHAHVDIMERVVKDIANTELGHAPDWRAVNVRRLICKLVQQSTVEHWRRLESLGKGHGFDYGGSHKADPLFDVEAFTRDLPTRVHNLPWDESTWDAKGFRVARERGLTWTCDVKEWGRRQDAAKRGAEAGVDKPAKPRDSALQSALQNDPVFKRVAKQVAKQVPAPVSTETTSPVSEVSHPVSDIPQGKPESAVAPRSAPKSPRPVAVADLPADRRQELGSRGKPVVDLGKHRGFHQILTPSSYQGPPPYFPALKECQNQCTQGATYCRQYQGDKPTLWCLNEDCWAGKEREGKAQFRSQVQERAQKEAQEDSAAAAALAAILPQAVALPIVTALLSAVDFEPYVPSGLREFAYVPGTLKRLQDTLKVTRLDYRGLFDRPTALAAAQRLPDALPEVAALLLVYTNRTYWKGERE